MSEVWALVAHINREVLVYRVTAGEDPSGERRDREKSLWKDWSPANQTGLNGLMGIRASADRQSSSYSAEYGLTDLWIAEGLR
jgi:hypothetical protein